jgi:hypothetical protein
MKINRHKFFLFLKLTIILSIFSAHLHAQSMLDQMGPAEPTTEYVNYSFKTNRIINLHSTENTGQGVLDVKISHRFTPVDEGFYDLFGLDAATQRIGVDYGVTDNLQIGVNRNSVRKAFDGYLKYRLLRQSTGKRNMPFTLSLFTSIAYETLKWEFPDRVNYNSSRAFYTNQILLGRKFNDYFSLELAPTHIHRNLTVKKADPHDIFALGIGGRVRLTRRLTFNFEYIPLLTKVETMPKNSLSIGVDIETGGHVFQLHFTNSDSMAEYRYVAGTQQNWGKNAIRFGFNVSRVFTIYNAKAKDLK